MTEVSLFLLGELGGELGDRGICPLEGLLHVGHALQIERAPLLLWHEQVESEGELDSTGSRLWSLSLCIISATMESLMVDLLG